MIKFFRNIRQNLLQDSKIKNYLKYAIGEIVLVMIGIILALQVNNWNELRKDRIKEQAVLKQLQEDYQANLIQLEEKMETRKKILVSAFQLLKAFDEPVRVIRDSVINDLANINHDPTYDPIQNDLAKSENLNLISNNRLKRLLSNWSSDVVGVQEIEVLWSKSVYEQYHPIISELGLGRDVLNSFMNNSQHLWLFDNKSNYYKAEIGNSKLGSTLHEILTSKKLEQMVSLSIAFNKAANLQSEALRFRILEILDLIKAEQKQ